MSDWKQRLGVLYSTDPNYQYITDEEPEADTLEPRAQKLRVSLSKKHRGGKEVSLVTGFIGREADLKELERKLKQACGVGGSSKDGEIIIQGDKRSQVVEVLHRLGYTQTKSI